MKKIYVILVTVVLGFILISCGSSKIDSFTPTYKSSDYVQMTKQEKDLLLDDVKISESLEETVHIGFGGSFDFSASTQTDSFKVSLNIDANIYLKYADTIDDFILYAEVKDISFKAEGHVKELPNTANITASLKDSFIYVSKGDLYYQMKANY